MTGQPVTLPAAVVPRRAAAHVLAALAQAAAHADGHAPCPGFQALPGGWLGCPCGITFEVTIPRDTTGAAA